MPKRKYIKIKYPGRNILVTQCESNKAKKRHRKLYDKYATGRLPDNTQVTFTEKEYLKIAKRTDNQKKKVN